MRATGTRLVTTNYVIDETATRLRYDLGLPRAIHFREALRQAERIGQLDIAWIDRRLADSAWSILQQYADVAYSFTDATSIAVARSRRIREVFAFDEDLEAAGLTVSPA